MMNAPVIDTLRYAKRLEDAGVDTRQAEAMALAINDQLTGDMATKTDLDHTAAALKGDIDRVETTLPKSSAWRRCCRPTSPSWTRSSRRGTPRSNRSTGGLRRTDIKLYLMLAVVFALELYNAYRSHVVYGAAAASPAPDSPVSETTATPEPATPTQAPAP